MPHQCKYSCARMDRPEAWGAHLCPHLFAMVYEGELAAVWGHNERAACPVGRTLGQTAKFRQTAPEIGVSPGFATHFRPALPKTVKHPHAPDRSPSPDAPAPPPPLPPPPGPFPPPPGSWPHRSTSPRKAATATRASPPAPPEFRLRGISTGRLERPAHRGRHVISTRTGISFFTGTANSEGGSIRSEQ